jgi:hypothetical protein
MPVSGVPAAEAAANFQKLALENKLPLVMRIARDQTTPAMLHRFASGFATHRSGFLGSAIAARTTSSRPVSRQLASKPPQRNFSPSTTTMSFFGFFSILFGRKDAPQVSSLQSYLTGTWRPERHSSFLIVQFYYQKGGY